jgi:peptide/nickel transport system substrate-binding protein
VIAAGASGGAAALFLAACGSDGGTSGPAGESSLLTEPRDTTKSAQKGGTFKWSWRTEPLHLDGIAQGQAQLNQFNYLAYGSLVDNKPGHMEASTYTEVVPNLAESWEYSPDRTQITFKLRQGVKFHNKPPVHGRTFDSSDVVATWNRYVTLPANNAAANANVRNPNAPVLSVTAPDARTVVYQLKEPASYIMQRLARLVTGELGTIQPRETGETFDPKLEQIGTGGFILEEWTPSVRMVYRRNTEYWKKDEVHIDRIESPFLREYAAGIAQLKSGGLHEYSAGVRAEDILTTKRESPQLGMYSNPVSNNSVGATLGLGWLPWGSYERSPFLDARVRQALALSFDRDIFIDTFGNVAQFKAEGLPVATHYYTSVGYIPGVTLDPRDESEFGTNAKYYGHNPAEAKKLISAAGFADGIDLTHRFVGGGEIGGPQYTNEIEVLMGWAKEVGFNSTAVPIDYNLEYLPQFVTGQGKHEGILFRSGAVTSPDPLDYFVWRFWSKSGPTSGSLGLGVDNAPSDAKVDQLIEKASAETENAQRIDILKDLQRHLAEQQYCVTRPGVADGFLLAWPAVANYQVYQGSSKGNFYYWWLDQSKPPFV